VNEIYEEISATEHDYMTFTAVYTMIYCWLAVINDWLLKFDLQLTSPNFDTLNCRCDVHWQKNKVGEQADDDEQLS